MMGFGGWFLAVIVRGGSTWKPRGALEWTGAVLSGLLLICAGSLVLLVLSTRVISTGVGSDPAQQSATGKPAENFSFRLVSSDARRSLNTYDGKVVLVNFWATWCAPCREEMPALSRLQENYGSEGLRVLTISDETRKTLQNFEHDPPLETTSGYLPDPSKLPEPFDRMQRGRPVSFLIDRQGRIQGRYVGARSYEFFEQAIASYL